MTTTTTYYNAKPSEISNIGEELWGASRHRFDTYENPEELRKKKEKKKKGAGYKLQIKEAIMAPDADGPAIFSLLFLSFKHENDLDLAWSMGQVREYIETEKIYELIRGYNKLLKLDRLLSSSYWAPREISKLRRRYSKKNTFKEETGKRVKWSTFTPVEEIDVSIVSERVRAVQFGNSVTDKERAYIIENLIKFLDYWETVFPTVSLSEVGWSFGARGKPGSVAHFQPMGKIIAVNRDNIGSIIHEVGHYIDYSKSQISESIPREIVYKYIDKLKKKPDFKDSNKLRYYAKRTEIFARAFEAYCLKHYEFSSFSQDGDTTDHPELCDVLTKIVEKCIA